MADAGLVQSIKRTLAEQSSDELRKMLNERDEGQYSEEAFLAAQELLDARARGQQREPPTKPPPPPPLTPAQREAAADALLRRQVRLVGAFYYAQAVAWALFMPLTALLPGADALTTVVMTTPAVGLWLLGRGVRRFSPTARGVAIVFSMLQVPAVPLGTVIGLYSFDKLMRADHLFGGKGHPGERGRGHSWPNHMHNG
jgi:hypothetical protein